MATLLELASICNRARLQQRTLEVVGMSAPAAYKTRALLLQGTWDAPAAYKTRVRYLVLAPTARVGILAAGPRLQIGRKMATHLELASICHTLRTTKVLKWTTHLQKVR